MKKQLIATAFAVVLAGAVPIPAAVADDPTDEDRVFFDELEHEGFHPAYDKQICGEAKCESLGEVLVHEGHEVCSELDGSPRLVPISVIAHLQVTPGEAHAIINAARLAYCAQAPDPYRRSI